MDTDFVFYGCSPTAHKKPDVPDQAYTIRKIPFSIIEQSLSFFRGVWLERNKEVCVFITHTEEDGFDLALPPQEILYANVEWINDGSTPNVVGSNHSHHSMTGNFSNTDFVDNRANPGLHLVIGSINSKPTIDAEIVINADHVLRLGVDFEIEDLVEDWSDWAWTLDCPEFLKNRQHFVDRVKDKSYATKTSSHKPYYSGYGATL